MSIIYRTTIKFVDRFVPNRLRPYWNSEAGPKTVFFWGAVVKGGLVAAGLGDLNRPAESLSSSQSLSLAVTGVIWARWCMVIIPKNYPLFVINSFVGATNLYQFVRALNVLFGYFLEFKIPHYACPKLGAFSCYERTHKKEICETP